MSLNEQDEFNKLKELMILGLIRVKIPSDMSNFLRDFANLLEEYVKRKSSEERKE